MLPHLAERVLPPNYLSFPIVRLPEGMSREEGEARIASALQGVAPAPPGETRVVQLRPLRDSLVANGKPTARVLFSGAMLILLLVTINLIHLLLAQGVRRGDEIITRAALGASRWRIARLFVMESALLGAAGIAGGLLMGAIANMRPDLWAAVIAQVPFVDMLNTMSDAEHPLVPMFRPDWGDPLADAQDYDYIASISPYENVREQAYPSILATTAVRDDRVGYWEPAKWIAAMREKSTSKEPILFKIDMVAGHQGGAGRSDHLELMAMFHAYAQWAVDRQARA